MYPNIMFKMDAPMARDLRKATTYWRRFIFVNDVRDIYTGEPLAEEFFERYGSTSIDHFIPWSFVLHDEMCNLVPIFRNVNSTKNDGLPNLELYLDEFFCL